ncbi:MAG TPA: chromosome partitioning protein ParB [Methylococcaceae bacterium]|nr:chromosome partitioning protein ParB [Methylococcaceae bacterium]
MNVKKRGLGRGLDALLGEIPTIKQGAQTTNTLPVDVLQRGKYQPRTDINPERLQELANSIAMQGIVQPIVVRSVAPGRYEIIAGERRWRAAQIAGLQEVPVIIKDMDDRTAIAIALIENIQREDLNALEEAQALHRLLTEFSMTHQDVADAVGKSRATITNLLRLLELQTEVKKMLQNNQIDMGHARALLPLVGEAQISLARKIVNQGLSVRVTEQLVKTLLQPKSTTTTPRIDTHITQFQRELDMKFDGRLKVESKKNGSGKLVFFYTTQDELNGILSKIV